MMFQHTKEAVELPLSLENMSSLLPALGNGGRMFCLSYVEYYGLGFHSEVQA